MMNKNEKERELFEIIYNGVRINKEIEKLEKELEDLTDEHDIINKKLNKIIEKLSAYYEENEELKSRLVNLNFEDDEE